MSPAQLLHRRHRKADHRFVRAGSGGAAGDVQQRAGNSRLMQALDVQQLLAC